MRIGHDLQGRGNPDGLNSSWSFPCLSLQGNEPSALNLMPLHCRGPDSPPPWKLGQIPGIELPAYFVLWGTQIGFNLMQKNKEILICTLSVV